MHTHLLSPPTLISTGPLWSLVITRVMAGLLAATFPLQSAAVKAGEGLPAARAQAAHIEVLLSRSKPITL